MSSWFLWAGTAGYPICMVLAARMFYGILRRQLIVLDSRESADPVERFEVDDRPGAVAAAVLAGLVWPLAVPAYAAHRAVVLAVTARPRPGPYERGLRARRVRERIGELEELLDIPADDPAHGEIRR